MRRSSRATSRALLRSRSLCVTASDRVATARSCVEHAERIKEPGKYGDGRNLYLNVGPNGSRSWLFIYRRLGDDRMRGLGAYPAVGLDEARAKAAEYRAMLIAGVEPPKGREAVKKKEEGRTFA